LACSMHLTQPADRGAGVAYWPCSKTQVPPVAAPRHHCVPVQACDTRPQHSLPGVRNVGMVERGSSFGPGMSMSSRAVGGRVGRGLGEVAKGGAGGTMPLMRWAREERPVRVPSVLCALQPLLVMFAAMIASPLVIGQLLTLSPELRTTMVTGVMIGCGIGTII